VRRRQPARPDPEQHPEQRAADQGELARRRCRLGGCRPTRNGVDVAEYDEPGLKTLGGVADVGFALSAWFVDPDGNTLGLLQFKDRRQG